MSRIVISELLIVNDKKLRIVSDLSPYEFTKGFLVFSALNDSYTLILSTIIQMYCLTKNYKYYYCIKG